MSTHNTKIFTFDAIRALCMFWIVVVWHGNDYLPMAYHWESTLSLFEIITKIVLMIFTILSGILLSKYQFTSFHDVVLFYKKRFSRFYVLFLIAAVLFCCHGWFTWKMLIKCILGISMFFKNMPLTLWYMSMLMCFYCLTPLFAWKYKYKPTSLIFAILLTVILYFTTHYAWQYFICYFIGLYFGQSLICLPQKITYQPTKITTLIVANIAYASFCMYLFHRLIFNLFGRLFGYAEYGNIIFEMPLWANIITVLFIFALSWMIQKTYDMLLKRIGKK